MERITRRTLEMLLGTLERTLGAAPGTYHLVTHNPGDGRRWAIEDARGRRILSQGSLPARALYVRMHAAIDGVEEAARIRTATR